MFPPFAAGYAPDYTPDLYCFTVIILTYYSVIVTTLLLFLQQHCTAVHIIVTVIFFNIGTADFLRLIFIIQQLYNTIISTMIRLCSSPYVFDEGYVQHIIHFLRDIYKVLVIVLLDTIFTISQNSHKVFTLII